MFKLNIEGAYIQEEGGDVNIFYTGSQLYTVQCVLKTKIDLVQDLTLA